MQVDEGVVAGGEDEIAVDDAAAAETPHEGTEGEVAALLHLKIYHKCWL